MGHHLREFSTDCKIQQQRISTWYPLHFQDWVEWTSYAFNKHIHMINTSEWLGIFIAETPWASTCFPLLWGSAEGARQSAVWGDPCATRSGHPESCSDWTWASCIFQYISIYLYIYISIYQYINILIYQCIYISIYLYIYISIYLYLCISISLSIIYTSERFTSWTVFLEGLLHLMDGDSGLTTFCWLRWFSGQIIYTYIYI